MKRRFKLIVIGGPTAVGKTEIAFNLARETHCELLSADSRQVYCELKIGTAKPDRRLLEEVTCHFTDHVHISEYYSAGKFETEALKLIQELSRSYTHTIMVGGSGLYIQAVCHGLDSKPGPDMRIREQLVNKFSEEGLESLSGELKSLDPVTWDRIDLKNPKRVIRALEIIYQTGRRISEFKNNFHDRPFDILKIGLTTGREVLYKKIDQRADEMLAAGLLDEVKKLLPHRHLIALQTVGYQEFFDYLDGKYDLVEAVRLFKRNSRRYAKRQLTWFKKDPGFIWFQPTQYKEIKDVVFDFLDS